MALTAEQVDARRTGFGGSDAAAACGISRWKSPLALYMEKRGESPAFEGNERTKWGEALEPVIRQEYAERTGRIVRLPVETLRHAKHGFMLCHPDGVTEDGRLFEAKNTRHPEGWGEPGTDEVPQEHLIQVQHNMAVTGLPVADVVVLIGGSDFRIYEVPADPETQDLIASLERELWSSIERGVPPAPRTREDAALLFGGRSVERKVHAGQDIEAACETLRKLRSHAETIEQEIEAAEVAIKAAMGEADTLMDGAGRRVLATWKAAKGACRLDGAALLAAHPEIHGQFTRIGAPTRRFLLKDGSR